MTILEELPKDNPYRVASAQKRAADFVDGLVADAKKAKKPVTVIADLTPALASVLLERNPENRKVTATLSRAYTRDMEDDNWTFNGEPIIVADTGELNDGQHRCIGVINSGRTIQVVLIVGVPRDSRTTLDQGRARSNSDYLSMLGFHNTSQLASAANFAWQFKHRGQIADSNSSLRASKHDIIDFVERHPGLQRSLRVVTASKANRQYGGASVLAFCHFAISNAAGHELADQFIDTLYQGANLGIGHPILYIRNRIPGLVGKGMSLSAMKIELIFRAWNMYRRGSLSIGTIPIRGELPKLEG